MDHDQWCEKETWGYCGCRARLSSAPRERAISETTGPAQVVSAVVTGSAFYRRACRIKVSLTAAVMTRHEAIEQFAAELRRIADVVEEGVTTMESGNMGCADMGSWEMDDPWENDEPNDPSQRTSKP